MKALLTVLWHVPLLGFVSAIVTILLGGVLTLTGILAPLGLGYIQIGLFLFAPFHYGLVRDAELASAPRNKYWQAYSMLIRCLYLPIGLVHVLLVVIVIATLCLSLFGIPWGLAMAKSLGACLNPVGIKCVSQAVAEAVQQRRMRMQVAQRLGSPQGQAV